MKKCLVVAMLLAAMLATTMVVSALAPPPGCTGQPNTLPVVTATPTLVSSVANGKRFAVPVDANGPPLNVLHLYGTPYEMGYAQGQMAKAEVAEFFSELPDWIANTIENFLPYLPKEIAKIIEEVGVQAALDLEVLATEAYTPQHFKDEMRGLADATGVSYDTIYSYTMLPELIKASCSMMGIWGPAVKDSNPLVQLRALDWGTNGPFQKWPAVVVYHPNAGQGHAFASVTWLGFVGSVTGYSSAPLGICEKVWLSYNETSARMGIPFHFLMRDVQQFDRTVDAALTRIAEAARTCSVWLGLGTPSEKFTVVGYSYEEVNIWDWEAFPVWENHPRYPGVLYLDKHVQPSKNPCLSNLISQYQPFDAVDVLTHVTAELQTGDMHAAIYDFGNNLLYVTNASPYVNNSVIPAYNRPWVRLNMTNLFQLQQ